MKNLIRFLMACMCISANAIAGNYTWTGATNSNWSTSTNWSPNAVPGASDTITINSTSTNLVLSAKQTIRRLVINSDTLDLGGDTLEITGSAGFLGGRINNGVCYPQCTGLLNFAGTLFNANVIAKGQIRLNGCAFNSTAFFEHVGSAAGFGSGGNTFNGTTTLKNSGTSLFRIGGSSADTFNGNAFIINSTNSVQLSMGANTFFNGNVEISSSWISGINIGGTGVGYTYLAAGKTITSGPAGIIGSFVLRNFIQYGTTPQSFTSNGILNMTGCVFNGNLTCSAQSLLLSGNTFYGTTSLTKTGVSSDFSAGGNQFFGAVTFNNNATNTATMRLASSNGDSFNGDVTFNTNTGQIQVAYFDTTEFKGHISTNNNARVSFGTAGGYSLFMGANDQVLSGTGDYVFSRVMVEKPTSFLTLQKPMRIDSVLIFFNGIIKGDSINKVTIGLAGSITGMSHKNYIDAAVLKIGNTAFTFPVGSNGEYRPITMSAPSAITDRYEAQYYKQQQGFGTTLDTGLNYISTCNYFRFERLQGASTVSFSTNWYNYSCDVFDIDSTKLAGFQNGVWKNLGLMGYTGSDSIGSYTSSSTISAFRYFTTAHQLFPRINFEVSYDSSTNPVLVNFVNLSRGIPIGAKYYFINNNQFNQGALIDSLTTRGTFGHFYPKYYQYKPVLFTIINGDTLSFTKTISLFNVANCEVSYHFSTNTPHPPSNPYISACYDEFIVRISINNLIHDPTVLNELEIRLPAQMLNIGSVGTCIADPPLHIDITPTATGFYINYNPPPPTPAPYAGIIEFRYYLTNCSLFTLQNSNLFNFQFNLLPTTVQIFNYTSSGVGFTPPDVDPTSQSATYSLTLINKPELDFEFVPSPDPTYSPGDVITREYTIAPKAGIINMFSLDVVLAP